jgi:hypothetical protein
MTKRILFLIVFSAAIFESYPQFVTGKHYAGPMIGLSFLGSTFQIGGGYEYGIDIENFGKIGVGGLIRYWSYSESAGPYQWDYTDFLIGAQGNYHFNLSDTRFDPWAGLVLAYDAGSADFDGPLGFYAEPSYGGLWLGLHGGLRYWIQPNLALSSRIGFGNLGYGALDVGVDFKF